MKLGDIFQGLKTMLKSLSQQLEICHEKKNWDSKVKHAQKKKKNSKTTKEMAQCRQMRENMRHIGQSSTWNMHIKSIPEFVSKMDTEFSLMLYWNLWI